MLNRQLESDSISKWNELIEGYSARRLTYLKDKLPAVGGVAAEIQKVTGSRYLAGLWRETLREDFLWRVCGERYPRTQLEIRPSEYISPS
jgi:hypothetical protein